MADVSELHKNYFGVEIKGAIIGVLGIITTAQHELVALSLKATLSGFYTHLLMLPLVFLKTDQ